jgi:hypothetical protein
MATTYDSIYDRFLGSITDYELAALIDAQLESDLLKFLKGAITDFKYCTKDLTDRDDAGVTFNIDLTEIEQDILSKYMLVRWLNPNFLRLENIRTSFGNKDFQGTSGGYTLEKLGRVKRDLENEADSDMVFYYYAT